MNNTVDELIDQKISEALTRTVQSTGHKLLHSIGDTVYLVTDREQRPRMVTGMTLRPQGMVLYYLSVGSEPETSHYAIEISKERDIILATS